MVEIPPLRKVVLTDLLQEEYPKIITVSITSHRVRKAEIKCSLLMERFDVGPR